MMISDKRKRIWRRLRFWGGMALVLVVGIGLLAYISYRKSMGPPPTPPGKSPEFDQHLAEIDKDWLFVFSDLHRVVLTDIYGRDVQTLVDSEDTVLFPPESIKGQRVLSPDGHWLVIWYMLFRHGAHLPCSERLMLIDTGGLSVRTVGLRDSDSTSGICIGWLDNSTFVVCFYQKAYGRATTPLLLRYSIHDLESAEDVGLAETIGNTLPRDAVVVDETFRAMFFRTGEEDIQNVKVLAYDSNGFREATDGEKDGFKELQHVRTRSKGWESDGGPPIEVKERSKPKVLARILNRFGIISSSKFEIRIGGRMARRVASSVREESDFYPPTWDEEIRLYRWEEWSERGLFKVYYMDAEGRYRFWRKGLYCGKIPRWKGESEESEER